MTSVLAVPSKGIQLPEALFGTFFYILLKYNSISNTLSESFSLEDNVPKILHYFHNLR